MEQTPLKKFSSPDEEIAFLRTEVARRERELLERNKDIDSIDHETIGKEVMREYAEHDPSVVLNKNHAFDAREISTAHASLETATHKVDQILVLAEEKGVRNALSVLEKMSDPFLTDEVHRNMVAKLRGESKIADLEKGAPLWKVLSMTLYEIALPRNKEDEHTENIKSLFSGMEQFYAGMQTISGGKQKLHYTLEIAVSDKRDDIIFYVSVPNEFVNLFEKQALSLFPHAVLLEQQNDYNIFVDGGSSMLSVLSQKKHPIYPLKMHDAFENDPLAVLLNAFSKIERDGGGASVQVVISGDAEFYNHTYGGITHRMEKGEETDVAIRKSTLGGELFEGFKGFAAGFASSNQKEEYPESKINTEKIELFNTKISSPIINTNIRLVVSAQTDERANQILTELESSFNQFQNTRGNQLVANRQKGINKIRGLKAFSFREYVASQKMPLSLTELSTLIHFPSEGVESSPQFKQSRAKHAPAPIDMPVHGTLLGENEFRNTKKKIYLTPEDRLRHFYVIGQTGTGKTTLLKNMIAQDIQEGAGVCMIDPLGTDIFDVLSTIPPERMDDLIYFDPSNMDTAIGLNMLDFDPRFPEQKTFVVNELFSIFQKLYGGNPESMGPMFEQYFRNATLLVLEDPESGSTLLDISRVMADAEYRAYKLSKAKNPVVVQFWKQIASKAGGEASLENIVPYIVSKFDVFTANDYMRPIIGQQKSSFNFREIMDSKKILLVNLSKGKLGEINSNLIGMIIVGKILMAALSRVDDVSKSAPPFYLYIDEFQNVTTDSISSILSEARKYKLGLTIAHQYIAQIEEGIRDSIFGNIGSIAAFRVGTDDAEVLAKQFEPVFSASDLVNIENRNAYVRLLSDGSPTTPFSIHTIKPNDTDLEYAKQMIEFSSLRYGTSREIVDAEIRARYMS
ncbi:MAG: DUF87 domain-containing protein [Candidatus Pacebacteria bacterium]|nr:DUF87 domain-containing protein [Candidatus Paceibacterota bacterium]MCF7857162.1 DUF87 domain-containing protein [Candidatus Paceibacterota bacterium]